MAPFTAEETRGRRSMHVAMQELEGQRHSLDSVCLMDEIALGWHQDMAGSFGVQLGGRVCGSDSTSLEDSREGSVTWGQSRSCFWKQHMARKRQKESTKNWCLDSTAGHRKSQLQVTAYGKVLLQDCREKL